MESFYRNEYRNSIEDLFIENNYENLDDEKSLELLLLYTLTIQQAGAVAKRLIERFGSLAGVIGASFDELIEIGGMDRDSAVLVSLAGNIASRALLEKSGKADKLTSSKAAADYFSSVFEARKDKQVCACFCDNNGKILREADISLDNAAASICVEEMKKCGANNLVIGYRAKSEALLPDDGILNVISELGSRLNNENMKLCDVISIWQGNSLSFADDLRYILYLGNY